MSSANSGRCASITGWRNVVLVLGVGDEQADDAAHVARRGAASASVAGVDVAGGVGDAEQLVADALVDVLVEVEGDDLEVGGLDGERREDGSDGHGVLAGSRRSFGTVDVVS